MKKILSQAKTGVKDFFDVSVQERSNRQARKSLLEELFKDFYTTRRKIYWLNFIRGICFGFGVVFGSTIMVAFVIWFLSQTLTWVSPEASAFINDLIDVLRSR